MVIYYLLMTSTKTRLMVFSAKRYNVCVCVSVMRNSIIKRNYFKMMPITIVSNESNNMLLQTSSQVFCRKGVEQVLKYHVYMHPLIRFIRSIRHG